MVNAHSVVDVRGDTARPSDSFFVDTNVWRFFTYTKFTTGDAARNQRAVQAYSAYINVCLKASATLYFSPLSYSELSAAIERTECDLYNAKNPTKQCSLKQFRLGTAERQGVVAEMTAAWGQITTIGTALSTPTDSAALKAAVELFVNNPLDGYDIFYVNAMQNAGLTAVITDDIDFTRVSGLRVFTANDTALQQAQMFRKVVTR